MFSHPNIHKIIIQRIGNLPRYYYPLYSDMLVSPIIHDCSIAHRMLVDNFKSKHCNRDPSTSKRHDYSNFLGKPH